MKKPKHESAFVMAAVGQELLARQRIPSATYRIQFNNAFTFGDAKAIVPYLHELGITDCYASPLWKTCSQDSHGYDICDHSQLNTALGNEDDLERFCAALRERGMGLVLDVVPNHMGISAGNVWWMDVLENGPSSAYSSYFDIDWDPVKPELKNKVLLPVLEDQYGKVLESGKLSLAYADGAFFICYHQTRLPVAPRTYGIILGHLIDPLTEAFGEQSEPVQELQSIVTALSHLPERMELDPQRVAERNREKNVIKRRIAAMYDALPEVRAAIDSTVRIFNGAEGDPQSFDRLDALIDAQTFRLAFWRVAAEEINYRRFFDINDLAAIRIELPEVFEATHRLVLRLLAQGDATGLRVDYPDGLWDPGQYLLKLQASYVEQCARLARPDATDDLEAAAKSWLAAGTKRRRDGVNKWPLYAVAEKILSKGESLPHNWAVYGTTGYDFLNAVNGLFIDRRSRRFFERIYSEFVRTHVDFDDLVDSSKKMIMLVGLASEINALSRQLKRISEKNRHYRDFTLNSLTFAIREVIAALPVYRTYITGPNSCTPRDQASIEAAVAEAKKRNPRTTEVLFDFISDTLLWRNLQDFPDEDREKLTNFVMKFQQVSGPAMAKGLEDTALYIYNRLVSLNEVGGNPEEFGISVAAFHRKNMERHRRWPHSLLATSTHDTKRSEDVRARINVLSELPREWRDAVRRWSQLNASNKTMVDGEPAPDSNDEYLLYQTLLGAWPVEPPASQEFQAFRERIAAYMLKATKEAKVHTSWLTLNKQYDAAVQNFVLGVLPDGGIGPFLDEFASFQRRVAHFGQFNALAQVLLKLTSPGVPDLYQGTELWDFSLVDPDNRRPVDYRRRSRLLTKLKERVRHAGRDLTKLAQALVKDSRDGRIKLYLTYRTLDFRRAHSELFQSGAYRPLTASGSKQEHVCAFARMSGQQAALIVVPRLIVRLTEGVEKPPLGAMVWKDTRLAIPHARAGQSFRNLFTGEVLRVDNHGGAPGLPLATICAHFPVALLEQVAE